MKNRIISIVVAVFVLSGCHSGFDKFKEDALAAASDKKIDEREFELLVRDVEYGNEKGVQHFKDENGNVDNSKVVSYLLKYLKAENRQINQEDIWQPEASKKGESSFNIHVYLENSASMDGYVKGVTDFETAIYNLLGDFKISGVCDSLNLNYINKSIPYTRKNALPADIQDFIEKLEPSTFRQRGGDRSVSDLSNILNHVLNTIDEKNAAVLISDFVFSPGSKVNAQDYLNNQGVGIKISFAEKLKKTDLSAVVIQLQSDFDGLYYDKKDIPVRLQCKRPYYIWVIGTTKQVASILDKKILDNIKGGYLNRFVLQSIKEPLKPNYKILYRPRIGEFDSESLAEKTITHATPDRQNRNKGLFGFSVAVDFRQSLQDQNYHLDTANYRLSDLNYRLNIESLSGRNDASLSGFTHQLNLQTQDLREETLTIDLIGKIPTWVYQSTSEDDSKIAIDDLEKQKTFGFKFLLEGVSDAFYPKSRSNAIGSIAITIKK